MDKATARREAHRIVADLIRHHLLAPDVEPFGDGADAEAAIDAALDEIAEYHSRRGVLPSQSVLVVRAPHRPTS